MRLRVAHVTATFPPYAGGTGNVCFANAKELVRRGHSVSVFTASVTDAPPMEMMNGISVHRLRSLIRVGNAPVLPSLLPRLSGFDIIHVHYPFFGGEPAAIAAKLFGTPLVITYHQDVLLTGPMRLVEHALRRSIGRASLRAADRILFTSHDYAQASHIRPLLRGRESIIGELPNGVDTVAFAPGPRPSDLRTKHQLSRGSRVVLLVANLDRMHAFKGVRVFLKALAALPAHVRGIVVGDGDLRESYLGAAHDLGVAERSVFAGRVSAADLPKYYRLADVTILPSTTMGEAFGLVLLESLASETPVVASDLPGVRTVVTPGLDGVLSKPNDADALAAGIWDILSNENRRRGMGRSGRLKVLKEYRWEAIGERLEGIYEELQLRT